MRQVNIAFVLLLCLMCTELVAQLSKTEARSQAIKHLQSNWEQYQLTNSDLTNVLVTDHYYSSTNGLTHLYLQQEHKGLPVLNARMHFHFLKNGDLLQSGGQFIQNLKDKAPSEKSALTATKALEQIIAKDLIEKEKINLSGSSTQYIIDNNTLSNNPIKLNLAYHSNEKGELKLVWEISYDEKSQEHWWHILLDAQTGEYLVRQDLIQHCFPNESGHCHNEHNTCATVNNTTQFSPPFKLNATATQNASYKVFPYPFENPNQTQAQIVQNPWEDANGILDLGWHDDGSVSYPFLRGNNVYVTSDPNGTNAPGYSPNNQNFNFNYNANLSQSPQSNVDAACTNLFYWSNLMHDVWYQYGFDEQAGNFQKTNGNRGGEDNDFLFADAQDGSGYDNANFVCPPDGEKPRMQMYLWSPQSNHSLNVLEPMNVAGAYHIQAASFGPSIPQSPNQISARLVKANDGSNDPMLACNNIQNSAQINGKIALVKRGNCNFTDKVKKVQAAGALACVVCNTEAGFINMQGSGSGINIPAVMVSKEVCDLLCSMSDQSIRIALSKSGGSQYIDGDFDNGIIAHEYGHGISTRLTGGPSNTFCLYNEEQMGEGISDWMALMMTMTEEDYAEKARSIGTYVKGQGYGGTGIRTGSYSTSFEINDFTYDNLCDSRINVPHGVGFIWASVLWDITWSMIDRYGFDSDIYNGNGGNNKAMQLVIDGLKLQNCSPGFVDARDAILLADQVNNNGSNQCLLWKVFAKRGLGFSADQGSSDDRCDGTAAFDLPPSCMPSLTIKQQSTPSHIVQNGSEIIFNFEICNNTNNNLYNVVVRDTLEQFLKIVDHSNIPLQFNGNRFELNLNVLNAHQTYSFFVKAKVESNQATQFYFSENDSKIDSWDRSNAYAADKWTTRTGDTYSGERVWYAPNSGYKSDATLTLKNPVMVQSPKALLWFKHRYDTESGWDGGVVEISTDNGNNWMDLSNQFYENGYNSRIEINPASPISGRPAFTGKSGEFVTSKIDLSNYFAEEVLIRFRMASDSLVAGNGWYIDNIWLMDDVSIENTAWVSNSQNEPISASKKVLISPGTFTPTPEIRFNVKAFLEGPFNINTNSMSSDYFQIGILPNNQPFREAPWLYNGNERLNISENRTDIIDWVLIELRPSNNPNQIAFRKAALLRSDGTLLDSDGTAGIPINPNQLNNNQTYHLSIKHTSHIGVISNTAKTINNSTFFNFTIAGATENPSHQKNINGRYMMYGGDYDKNGVINNLDFNKWRTNNALVNVRVSWDGDGNGVVNNLDYNLWFVNRSRIGSDILYD